MVSRPVPEQPSGPRPWTPRDAILLRTAQVLHALHHEEFDQIQGVPVDFAVPGVHPHNRVVAAAPYTRMARGPRGGHLSQTLRSTLGRSLSSALPAGRSAAQWQVLDSGTVYINRSGFFLRNGVDLQTWSWDSILEARLMAPARLSLLTESPRGHVNLLIDSDAAELVFGVWAAERQPMHPQYLQRIWLIPAWMQHYRSTFGPRAYPFDRA